MTHMFTGMDRPEKGSSQEWLSFTEVSPEYAVGRISDAWFDDVGCILREQLSPDTASVETLRKVQWHNPDSFWGLYRKQGQTHALAGLYGQLLLTEAGQAALIARTLNRLDPSMDCLVEYRQQPSAIYVWCVVAKRKGALLQSALATQLRQLSGIPYYATLATDDSYRIAKDLGMVPVAAEDDRVGGLFRLPSVLPTMRSAAERRHVTVKVVESALEFEQARAIRLLTFVGEQNCPFAEEFDGNDYSAQHLIGYIDGEPAASMRIRYFADFAKWERYCIAPPFRRTALKDELIALATDITTRKGYERIYFHAEPSLLEFWQRRGFSLWGDQRPIRFSDRTYLEFCRALSPRHDALSLSSDPMVLNRVEGQWDVAGVLDRSSGRDPTSPESDFAG